MQVQEPASYLFVALFVIRNLYNIFVFLQSVLSIRAWWNHLRMNKITSACAQFFGVLCVILKLLGLSETVFEVTMKDQFASSDNFDAGSFTFDESPIFIPGSTLLMVQLSALVMGLLGLQPPAQGVYGSGLGEFMCSVFVVLCFWPFVKGLFRKGKYGIPLSIICNSTALALLFVLLSRRQEGHQWVEDFVESEHNKNYCILTPFLNFCELLIVFLTLLDFFFFFFSHG